MWGGAHTRAHKALPPSTLSPTLTPRVIHSRHSCRPCALHGRCMSAPLAFIPARCCSPVTSGPAFQMGKLRHSWIKSLGQLARHGGSGHSPQPNLLFGCYIYTPMPTAAGMPSRALLLPCAPDALSRGQSGASGERGSLCPVGERTAQAHQGQAGGQPHRAQGWLPPLKH